MNATTLLDLFNEDIGHAEQLLELVEAEFQALSEHDLPRLQQILADKQPLLANLDQHGKNRTQILLGLELSADRAGLLTLAERSDQGDALVAASDQLSSLLESCQSANLRNGRIIRSSQKSTESMLGILRGNETPSLYDSSGGTAKVDSKRPLSQA
ncbi:flagellar biosynthesis protein FlgN [Pseudomonas daroniae]|uniref:Flagellar biosynthesis protein FlgN n=1 Tax=Phytopseudomonas daroniae TaxID=2487519 RepID=A0A4Q9QR42_9GAMM|nr:MULTISPECIES: flagellar export chaperone FlgN [Pseudomonas]TBU83393.1 flagellar biosynthesis protein FlgN [Pseudomonas daroniae]TBU85032.1 flagellar biosynthesis protein FlgN [Pseudomonas sp. FRB 228]TBU93675.1 flagellar biosynthesis protein FlgN [Pseudomonas daroniae]